MFVVSVSYCKLGWAYLAPHCTIDRIWMISLPIHQCERRKWCPWLLCWFVCELHHNAQLTRAGILEFHCFVDLFTYCTKSSRSWIDSLICLSITPKHTAQEIFISRFLDLSVDHTKTHSSRDLHFHFLFICFFMHLLTQTWWIVTCF